MAEAKTKPTGASVAAFLAAIPDEERRRDCRTVAKLMEAATGAKPVMWGTRIVGFGTYRYRHESGREGDWPVIGFSPRKNDLTLYIMPGFARYADLLGRLGRHKTSESCLYLRKLADVDLEVLEAIVGKAVADMAGKRVDRPS